ncbi:hypothetical protein DFH08DRAFT_879168 [Mycena albidolilacea]|uniref:FYVE-type domain-containing protein n=1 Tax=Mycena albidolilacea TaxID=1033008 RepID=A0AAD6ZS29_9AGAR|nr:hypothetical protein DFH08DRAFT_879168 [Mycena albidolilacea]
MSGTLGLPLLSGPPPPSPADPPASSCRKCSKEFRILLLPRRKCNHCGYSYCYSCTDYYGLMPRTGDQPGHDQMNVCGYCIEFLSITAECRFGRGRLKSMPLAKLKKYINAYGIKADQAVEKDDLIDAIIAAIGVNGCLSDAHENYYRKYSVPDRSTRSRGMFSRPTTQAPSEPPLPPRPNQSTHEFPRPDLAPDEPRYAPPPGPPPRSPPTRPASQPQTQPRHASAPRPAPHPTPQYHNPHSGYHSQSHFNSHLPPRHPGAPPAAPRQQQPNTGPYQSPRPSRSSHNLSAQNAASARTPPRARAASVAPPPTVPAPTLDQLLAMSDDALAALSVHALKEVLFTNHVNVGVVLEKSDLVKKVRDLIEEERRQRERQRLAEEAEEQERIEQQRVMMEQFARQQKEREEREKAAAAEQTPAGEAAEGTSSSSSVPPPLPPKAQAMASHLERTGLCVICQDEEANIAIVDCG